MSLVLEKLKDAARTRWSEILKPSQKAVELVHSKNLHSQDSVRLVPIASGKGGVGKTNMAVNLSIAAGLKFVGTKKRVLLIDGDLGMPSTDLVLGIRPNISINNLIEKTIDDIDKLITATRFPQLDFIAGAEEASLILGNLYYQQRRSLMGQISKVNAELVIFDLGASASKEVLDFFSMTSSGIVVLNPEPSSIRDGYIFIKNALIRRIRSEFESLSEYKSEFDRLNTVARGNFQILAQNVEKVGSKELREIWNTALSRFKPMIIINRVETLSEGLQTARKFVKNAESLLGIKIFYLGSVMRDEAVVRAVRTQCPFRIADPKCQASRSIDMIANNLLSNKELDLSDNFLSLGRIFTSRLLGRPI